jgi:Undecaprenyl-phosphate galactose phosphotransferase WbaP
MVALIAMLVKWSSKGPVFYGHERIGEGGRTFRAWKFRTMVENADETLEQYLQADPSLQVEWATNHKLKRDPRITNIGKLLRQTSLDELPQIWNVIRGEMSLVGPRPIVRNEVIKYGEEFDLYRRVRPGITGLWQVSGRSKTTYEERVTMDVHYVRNWSVWLDAYLLAKTVGVVLGKQGAY